jgi:hypothetical protein
MAPILVRNLGYWRRSGDIAVLPIPKYSDLWKHQFGAKQFFGFAKKAPGGAQSSGLSLILLNRKIWRRTAEKNGGGPAAHEVDFKA